MARFMSERQKFFYRIRCFCIPLAGKRVKFIRKHKLFAELGENVHFQPRLIPSDPQLIKIHNNVAISTGVNFVTHDISHKVINGMKPQGEPRLEQFFGCIEICDNVCIGANVTILPNVKIGPNVIVGANSVVTHDVEPNSVVVGIPARKIGTFDDYVQRHTAEIQATPLSSYNKKQKADILWSKFDQLHETGREQQP